MKINKCTANPNYYLKSNDKQCNVYCTRIGYISIIIRSIIITKSNLIKIKPNIKPDLIRNAYRPFSNNKVIEKYLDHKFSSK